MAKPRKTADQLLEMIAAEVPLDGVRVDIHEDPMGWHATAYGDPRRAGQVQMAIGNVVERLRATYDLDK